MFRLRAMRVRPSASTGSVAARARPVPRAPSRAYVTPSGARADPPFWAIFAACATSAVLGVLVARATPAATPPTDAAPAPALQYIKPEDIPRAIAALRAALDADKVTTDPDELQTHGSSMNDYHPDSAHAVVVYPDSTADVVQIMRVANAFRMPVVVYGGGTGLEGNFLAAPAGSICIDMHRMDRILAIHPDDADLVCQPGARWQDINATLKDQGIPLFFPLDPGPGASIGGMMSTGCSGTNAVRYGTAKGEWFLNATVVLPTGEVLKTRRRARKSSAGWDTTKLFVGAEGTLGVITEATLRLAPLLPTTVAVVQFPSVKHATEAVRAVLSMGVGIQCVELCDDAFMRATNTYGVSRKKWPEQDSLFFKFQGHDDGALRESARVAAEVCAAHGGSGFTLAADKQEADDLWQDRKNALWSSLTLRPGCKGWSTDVCVPVSKLPQLVQETKQDIADSGIVSTIVGHVGDGNFHALLLFEEGNKDEEERCKGLVHRMVERALRLDGTCTGEHGVGVGKKEYLYEELGENTVELMKRIKRTLDPLGLMNPGKLYPDNPHAQPNPRPSTGGGHVASGSGSSSD